MPTCERPAKAVWFTDTIDDLNGVARTVRAMSAAAARQGYALTVATCRPAAPVAAPPPANRRNFRPVWQFALPKYPSLTVTVPPGRALYRFLRRGGFDTVIVSTPGPVGLAALAAAKWLGLRTVGIDHTDFPRYVHFLTGSAGLARLTAGAMRLVYGRFDTLLVNSEYYRRRWLARGFAAERLHILPRGLDTDLFNPQRRDGAFWRRRGADRRVLLYVGRVSKEKELGFLAEIYRALRRQEAPVDLAVVGDGPYLAELRALMPTAIFTGALGGDELGAAYASADLFLFPSTTDTFGNVVIEAIASGLPVLVADVGGPQELADGRACRVLPAGNLAAWVNAVRDWLRQPPDRETLAARAAQVRRERNWDAAAEQFWTLTARRAA
ncbi:MAG: glycosyltransferase family 1 protein [Verrucomicrobiales bacterium]|jgi:glycosyltransferase involved in cell wall biosynthesis|nr:glycosyltransferase family 1 protein [Verrucomicrobiales bacterium]